MSAGRTLPFFYGFRSKVSDVKNAVVLMGFNAVKNAIILVSVVNALPKTLLFQDFEMIEFWKHSLAVAVTSKNIAQKAGVGSPDNGNAGFMMNIHLADILVNSYEENPDCTIDMGAMHPEVVKFLVAQMENSSDWYANLSDEIETARAFFLEDEF